MFHKLYFICKILTVFVFFFQNGYPARRRSLVDDARFETLVVKQTKQSVLEEARQRANGKIHIESILLLNITINTIYMYVLQFA